LGTHTAPQRVRPSPYSLAVPYNFRLQISD
jgi:hypothetical protein